MSDEAPSISRAVLEPHLVNLIAGLRREQVTLAVHLLLNYIDEGRGLPVPFIGESGAFELFRTFVRQNAAALRMVAHWGDGECGALHEVLLNELQGKSLFTGAVRGFADDGSATAGKPLPNGCASGGHPGQAPMFAEEGGVEGTG